MFARTFADMNKRTGFLFIVLAGLTAFIAWSATEPNEYMAHPGLEPAPQPYPWGYLAWMTVFSAVIVGTFVLKNPLARFIGSLFSFSLGAFLVVILAMSVMHSPPVHDRLLIIVFFSSLGLLFYSGYTCAIWLSKGQANDGGG